MRNYIRLVIAFQFILSAPVVGFSLGADSLQVSAPHSVTTLVSFREFPSIDNLADQPDDLFDLVSADVADSIEEKRARAHSLRQLIESSQRLRDQLDALSLIDLPMGIVRSGGSLSYAIVIDKVKFTKAGSVVEAYMSFTIPQTGDAIAFGGVIPLSKDGGIVGVGRVDLLGDHFVPLNESTLLTILGKKKNGGGTYVEFDCSGFKGMVIDAQLEFSRKFLIPEDAKGERIGGDERVKVNFTTYVQDWDELLVSVTLPPFQLASLKDVGFSVTQATLDWSDIANPPGAVYPTNYLSSQFGAGKETLWRGFFMKQGEVRLPAKLTKKDSVRIAFGVANLLIDDLGFTGTAYVQRLGPRGDLDGWSFTVDRFELRVQSNAIQEFSMVGLLTVPVFKDGDQPAKLGYSATIGGSGNFVFIVTLKNNMKLDMWAADVVLRPGSSVIVAEVENKFTATAVLNGTLTLTALKKGPKTKINGVVFEQMKISTRAPHFVPGAFGIGSTSSPSAVSDFPIVIKNIGTRISTDTTKVGIAFDLSINIASSSSEGTLSGAAGVIVWGTASQPSTNVNEKSSTPAKNWEFDHVEITGVTVDVVKPNVYEIHGQVTFFENDTIYGSGFRGSVGGKLHKVSGAITVLFGKKTFRYWFADALISIENGVTIAPSLAIYGIGGGYYSRMRQTSEELPTQFGLSPSGITYIPDSQTTGLRAFVAFGAHPNKKALNGDLALQISIFGSGGYTVSLNGQAYFLTQDGESNEGALRKGAAIVANRTGITQDTSPSRSQMYGAITLNYDNTTDVFQGSMEVFVHAAGGTVTGVGPNSRAGWASLYFGPDKWQVLVGEPNRPVGVSIANLLTSRSYFMLGQNLPASAPPPADVTRILGSVNMGNARQLNLLQEGRGAAFGMNFSVNTGDLRFLLFYGRFAAGAGFDIMLRNLGPGFHCAESGKPLGINGWFAEGQAYAFIDGKIGVKVDLPFVKGDYDILAIAAAAIMQAKGPNPFWMKGTVGGNYNILGGLVKGRCQFSVTVGEECTLAGELNPLQGFTMIAGITPTNGSNDVDVFTAPQVAFNIPIGETFDITDIEDRRHLYRARLETFQVGEPQFESQLRWNDAHDVVISKGRDILPPQTSIRAMARVVFEEQINDSWRPVLFQGQAVQETVETRFTTGAAPNYIPTSNIEVSYPLLNQYNFYTKQHSDGVIRLVYGQPYLFNPGADWIQKARMTDVQSKQAFDFDFTYNTGKKQVEFGIPASLEKGKIYRFELVNIPRLVSSLDANVTRRSLEMIQDEESTLQVATKELVGSVTQKETKALLAFQFRTSLHDTFVKKMEALPLGESWIQPVSAGMYYLGRNISTSEVFDAHELGLNGSPHKLIQFEYETNSKWYSSYTFPLVYLGYPFNPSVSLSRNPSVLGIPPIKAAEINQASVPSLDEQGLLIQGTAWSSIRWRFLEHARADMYELQNKAANFYSLNPDLLTARMRFLLANTLVDVTARETQTVKVMYSIPGVNSSNTTVSVGFIRP